MRILFVTLGTLFICVVLFFTVKFWGKSIRYVEYKHSFFQSESLPITFVKPNYKNLKEKIEGRENLFLEVSVTLDQILVTPLEPFTKPIRYSKLEEIKDKVITIGQIAKHLTVDRKVIFHLIENAHAMHEIIMVNLRKNGLEKGENMMFFGDYEAPIKALKEIAPALIYGSTKPEILRLVAMQSMRLLEAASFRADVVIHPLKIRNQDFFTHELREELVRRHKKFIVGPVPSEEVEAARSLQPFGIVLIQE
jgi:hypothetical protein